MSSPINILLPSSLNLGSEEAASGPKTEPVSLVSFGTAALSGQALSKAPMNQELLHPNNGESSEEIWQARGPISATIDGHFRVTQSDEYAFLLACVHVTQSNQIRSLAQQLYLELQTLAAKLGQTRFVRIWNYVPEINAGEGDNETYRQFCWGRADALKDAMLPAATGIGARDGWLRIGALCSTGGGTGQKGLQITHLENPRQVSAYRYPRDYGPRSPSFARATLIQPAKEQPADTTAGLLLLSGTASIVNHESLHKGHLERQSEETARNISALLSTLDRQAKPISLRYYLRDATRLPEAIDCFKAHFPTWPLPRFYSGDICRTELDLEIEAVFSV